MDIETYLRSTVRRNIVTSSHHDQTHNCNQNHDHESNSSIKQVQDFGDGHQACSTHNAGYHCYHREQRMLGKATRNISGEVCGETAVEIVDEIHQPHTIFALNRTFQKRVSEFSHLV